MLSSERLLGATVARRIPNPKVGTRQKEDKGKVSGTDAEIGTDPDTDLDDLDDVPEGKVRIGANRIERYESKISKLITAEAIGRIDDHGIW